MASSGLLATCLRDLRTGIAVRHGARDVAVSAGPAPPVQMTVDDIVVLRAALDDDIAAGRPLPTPDEFWELAGITNRLNRALAQMHDELEERVHAQFLTERAMVCGLTMQHPVEGVGRRLKPGGHRYHGRATGGDH